MESSGEYLNLQQSIKSGTSKMMIGNGRSIVVPKTTITIPANNLDNNNNHCFINPAYDNYGDSDESFDEMSIVEQKQQQQQQQQQQQKLIKRMARQVSFNPETQNQSKSVQSSSSSSKIKAKKTNSNDSVPDHNNNNENNDQSSNRQEGKEKPPEWDRFVTEPPPDEDETQKSEWVEVAIRWLKLFAYFFTFIMVLILSVCSKTLILLMTSMINVNHTVTICNNDDHYEIDPPLDHDKPYNAIYHSDSITRIAWCSYYLF
ncbi:hypothetical protein BLA29_002615 [Euroglyphus maynei]|uniref:Uncharacterized protein n=1 Tax=Euroglyphus maynei TaxID=6958 RepID=A0A1Y3ARR3_EURMA|nr:hypothetical protein BLA29_002615 [Euroglyphus maynei]